MTKVVSGKDVVTNVTVGDAGSRRDTQITGGVVAGDKVIERVVTFKADRRHGRHRALRRHRRRRHTRRVGGFGGGGFAGGGTGAGGFEQRSATEATPRSRPAPGTRRSCRRSSICDKVTKVYRTGSIAVAALRGRQPDIAQGEYVAIIGPSGSGKSTLMHILGCLDVPSIGGLSPGRRQRRAA